MHEMDLVLYFGEVAVMWLLLGACILGWWLSKRYLRINGGHARQQATDGAR
jgi:hypothetical protein